MPDEEQWAPETLTVHAGMPEETPGPVVAPISLSVTYRQTAPGDYGRWDYSRSGNPTRDGLETALARLEGGAGAGAFASGMAAIDTVLRFVAPRSRVVVSSDVYGGTWRLLNAVWRDLGMEISAVDLSDLDAARTAISGAALVILETPSNPYLHILDIAALCSIAHETGALVVVDNTFATPYLQQPLALGADFSVHSSTKYLGGHSDVVGGALIAASPEHAERVQYLQKVVGAVASPFDAYLVLRGMRTLAVRMDRQCQSALAIARALATDPAVAEVYYPGLASHPGHTVAARQMRGGFGGMVSFRHAGGPDAAVCTVRRTRLFTLAESLGAVESLIEVPAVMTHAASAGTPLEVPADLIRVSVGIENVDDLLTDLAAALRA